MTEYDNIAAVWLQMLQLNEHQQTVLSENLKISRFAVLSYESLLNKICNSLILVQHSVNKQKNNKRFSQIMFFQCSQNKQFYSYMIKCFHYSLFPKLWWKTIREATNSVTFPTPLVLKQTLQLTTLRQINYELTISVSHVIHSQFRHCPVFGYLLLKAFFHVRGRPLSIHASST